MFTSEPFISAVARGIWRIKPYWTSKMTIVKMVFPDEWQLLYEEIDQLVEDLTHFQALAIRDNNIEEFILNILPKE